MPIVLTTNIDDAKKIAENLTVYGQLPSYRAMLDREGLDLRISLLLVMRISYAVRSNVFKTWCNGPTRSDTEDGAYARTLGFWAA